MLYLTLCLFKTGTLALHGHNVGGDVGCKISRPTLCRVLTSEPSIDSVPVTLNRLATKCRPAGDRDQVAANSWHDRKMTTDEFLTSGSCLQRFFLQFPAKIL